MLLPIALIAATGFVSPRPIVLFDGKSTDEWLSRGSEAPCKWKVENGDLVVTSGTPDIVTRRSFRDYRLHLEFKLPYMPEATSQARANSGVYNLARYEIQILDSYKNSTYPFGGCGAIYGEKDPDANAILPPGEWNRYDIVFRAPRLNAKGEEIQKPRITVWQNGIKIHNDYEIQKGPTAAGLEVKPVSEGPILLQNHGCPVRFRNIWIVELFEQNRH